MGREAGVAATGLAGMIIGGAVAAAIPHAGPLAIRVGAAVGGMLGTWFGQQLFPPEEKPLEDRMVYSPRPPKLTAELGRAIPIIYGEHKTYGNVVATKVRAVYLPPNHLIYLPCRHYEMDEIFIDGVGVRRRRDLEVDPATEQIWEISWFPRTRNWPSDHAPYWGSGILYYDPYGGYSFAEFWLKLPLVDGDPARGKWRIQYRRVGLGYWEGERTFHVDSHLRNFEDNPLFPYICARIGENDWFPEQYQFRFQKFRREDEECANPLPLPSKLFTRFEEDEPHTYYTPQGSIKARLNGLFAHLDGPVFISDDVDYDRSIQQGVNLSADLSVLIALSEGPVRGIRDVRLEGGSFEPIEVEERNIEVRRGENEQPPLEDFKTLENSYKVDKDISIPKHGSPGDRKFVWEVKNPDIERIRLSFSSRYVYKTEGVALAPEQTGPYWAPSVEVDFIYEDGSKGEVIFAVGDKPELFKTHKKPLKRIEVYESCRPPWDEEIDFEQFGEEYELKVIEISEIIKIAKPLTFPNTALLQIRYGAEDLEQIGGLPQTSAIVAGIRVQKFIGDPKDPVQIKDPNYWVDASPNRGPENPAWAVLDLLLNKRYGLGAFVKLEDIDLASFQDAGDHCEELVDDTGRTWQQLRAEGREPKGRMRERFLLNIVLERSETAWELLNRILNAFRGSLVYSGGKFKLKVDKPEQPVQLFNPANIKEKTFSAQSGDYRDFFNRLKVQFLDEDKDWEQQLFFAESPALREVPVVVEPREKQLATFGITSRKIALREAYFQLRRAERNLLTVSFETGFDALAAEVWDVILISHEVPEWGWGGRLKLNSAQTYEVYLDRKVFIDITKTYFIKVRFSDDSVEEVKIKNPSLSGWYDYLQLEQDFTQLPKRYDLWFIRERTGPAPKPFRIISIERTPEFELKIFAIEYDESIYDPIDVWSPDVIYTALPNPYYEAPRPVTNFAGSLYWEKHSHQAFLYADLSWINPPDRNFDHLRIYYAPWYGRRMRDSSVLASGQDPTYYDVYEVGRRNNRCLIRLDDRRGLNWIFVAVSVSTTRREASFNASPMIILYAEFPQPEEEPEDFNVSIDLNNVLQIAYRHGIERQIIQGSEVRYGPSWDEGIPVARFFPGEIFEKSPLPPPLPVSTVKFFSKSVCPMGIYTPKAIEAYDKLHNRIPLPDAERAKLDLSLYDANFAKKLLHKLWEDEKGTFEDTVIETDYDTWKPVIIEQILNWSNSEFAWDSGIAQNNDWYVGPKDEGSWISEVYDFGEERDFEVHPQIAFRKKKFVPTWDAFDGRMGGMRLTWHGMFRFKEAKPYLTWETNESPVELKLFIQKSLDGTTWSHWEPLEISRHLARFVRYKARLRSKNHMDNVRLIRWDISYKLNEMHDSGTAEIGAEGPGIVEQTYSFNRSYQYTPDLSFQVIQVLQGPEQDYYLRLAAIDKSSFTLRLYYANGTSVKVADGIKIKFSWRSRGV